MHYIDQAGLKKKMTASATTAGHGFTFRYMGVLPTFMYVYTMPLQLSFKGYTWVIDTGQAQALLSPATMHRKIGSYKNYSCLGQERSPNHYHGWALAQSLKDFKADSDAKSS